MVDLNKKSDITEDNKNIPLYHKKQNKKLYFRTEESQYENISFIEGVFSLLLFGWLIYCTYAGIQLLYFDVKITNAFNTFIGVLITMCLTIELGIIALILVVGMIVEFLKMFSGKENDRCYKRKTRKEV